MWIVVARQNPRYPFDNRNREDKIGQPRDGKSQAHRKPESNDRVV